MLDRFGLREARAASAPTATTTPLAPEPHDGKEAIDVDRKQYLSIVGSLNYASHTCRPDIARAVSDLARFASNPKQHHYEAAQHLLRYLSGTKTLGLTYRRPDVSGDVNKLFTHSDSSYAPFLSGDPDNAVMHSSSTLLQRVGDPGYNQPLPAPPQKQSTWQSMMQH